MTESRKSAIVKILIEMAGGTWNIMDFQVGEVIKMKKPHPCGANEWKLLRVGMDFRLQCMNCGRQVMVPRKLVEKNFRGYIEQD